MNGDLPHTLFGDWYVVGNISQGDMAEVVVAKSTDAAKSDELFALKRILPKFSQDTNFAKLFRDELAVLSGLKHNNICQILTSGEHDEQLYIAMEFVHGKDLKAVSERGSQRAEPLTPRVSAYVVAKIARALDFAHHKTAAKTTPPVIVHRAINPMNIVISYEGVPKIIDFGVSKVRDVYLKPDSELARARVPYLSPEQVAGRTVDARSDIFSLGVVLYELLTGQLPFKGATISDTLQAIEKGDYKPVQTLNNQVPVRLANAVHKAMAKNPGDRYDRAFTMAAELELTLMDAKEVTEATLSALIRKLFRDEYINEMARIKSYKGLVVSSEAASVKAKTPAPTKIAQPLVAEATQNPPKSADVKMFRDTPESIPTVSPVAVSQKQAPVAKETAKPIERIVPEASKAPTPQPLSDAGTPTPNLPVENLLRATPPPPARESAPTEKPARAAHAPGAKIKIKAVPPPEPTAMPPERTEKIAKQQMAAEKEAASEHGSKSDEVAERNAERSTRRIEEVNPPQPSASFREVATKQVDVTPIAPSIPIEPVVAKPREEINRLPEMAIATSPAAVAAEVAPGEEEVPFLTRNEIFILAVAGFFGILMVFMTYFYALNAPLPNNPAPKREAPRSIR